jgi:hypothetical protein
MAFSVVVGVAAANPAWNRGNFLFFFPVDFTTDPSSNLEPSSLIVVRVMVDQIISKTNFPQVLSVDVHPTEPWLVHTSCFI